MTNKRILTLITLLLFLFLLAGCDWLTPNRPPEIKSVPVETATAGVEYVYDVNATDPDGDTLTYSLISVEPPGMEINPDNGKITWTLPIDATVGYEFNVTVQVEDEEGLIDTQDFTITISERELVGIEVDPETMTLPLDAIGTFKVTAHYNDETTEVVTSDCVYGIDDTSIAEVDKGDADNPGKVTALDVGTTTISINYTDIEDITKGTTLTVKVGDTITIRWLESAIRYNADGSVKQTWQNCPIPGGEVQGTPAVDPATLILTDGEYHFADIQEYFNWKMEYEGDVVITETGLLTGWATYTLYELPTKNDFAGQVEIIIYEEEAEYEGVPHDGTMVGTYTQLKYASGSEEAVLAKYPEAFLAPDIGPDWWFVQYTDYIVHQWEWEEE